MKKDAFYFPHFSNARNDSKIIKLRRIMGIEGYGLYFLLLEILREQSEFKLSLDSLKDLAYEWHTSEEKLMAVVANFDLFTIDNDLFFSTKLIYYLRPYIEKSEKMRRLAQKRWENATAIRTHSDRIAHALPTHMPAQSVRNASKVKESKVKESKVKESKVKDKNRDSKGKEKEKKTATLTLMRNSSITISDIEKDFEKRDDLKLADAAYYFNSALDWSNSKAEKRADWLATIRNFARRDIKDGKLKMKNGEKLMPWER